MKFYSRKVNQRTDVEDLYLYFKRYMDRNQRLELKSFLKQRAPQNLRPNGRFHAALQELVKQKRVGIVRYGVTEYVDFWPMLPLPSSSLPLAGKDE